MTRKHRGGQRTELPFGLSLSKPRYPLTASLPVGYCPSTSSGRTGLGLLILPLALAGCGAARELKPAQGQALPVAPYGAKATPTPNQLIAPATQQRPQRSDELLKNSEERRSDAFDLPPPN